MTKTARLSIMFIPLVMVFDALSKWWVHQALSPGASMAVVDNWVRFSHGHNSGMAFGLFQGAGRSWLVMIAPVTLALGVWFVHLLRTTSRSAWPLALILGGALANLVDRIPDGQVTDLVDLGVGSHRWPAFNVADAAITVGMIGLWWVLARQQDLTKVAVDEAPVSAPSPYHRTETNK